jgi:hypothetical protein
MRNERPDLGTFTFRSNRLQIALRQECGRIESDLKPMHGNREISRSKNASTGLKLEVVQEDDAAAPAADSAISRATATGSGTTLISKA